ncbi:MAG: hypothetical protein DRJ44_01095 [Thermoprotei archaeon]|nr:MAG: hypothetical protein DRJ44_01095 [Thermoprotei archaeon]
MAANVNYTGAYKLEKAPLLENEIEYKPIPVKELLKEMKNLSTLMVDLAYLSVLYNDVELAWEVYELEKRIDYLELLLTMQASLATRNVRDAEKIVSIHRLATASNKVSDAAADIAGIVLSKTGLPPLSIVDLFPKDSMVAKIVVPDNFQARGVKIRELIDELKVILNIMVIRRERNWILEPDENFVLHSGDVLLVEGTENSINLLKKYFNIPVTKPYAEKAVEYRRIAEGLYQLKNTSQVMLDLAYTALLTKSEEFAEKIEELEDYVDRMAKSFELEVILHEKLSAMEKLNIVSIAVSSENIADAALEMVEPLLKGLEPHPIIMDVLWETEERISVIEMDETDEGKTLTELGYGDRGITVLAVRRGDKWFITPPYTGFKVKSGDILIVKYFSESEEIVEELEKEEDREEMIEEIQEEEWEE